MAGLISDYLGQGLAASRPATPDAPTGTLSFYFAQDTATLSYYDWDGAAWEDVAGGGGPSTSPIVTVSTASTDLDPDDNGSYIRYTYVGAKTLTVRDDADTPYATASEFHIRVVGSSNLDIVEDTAVTINLPTGGTLEMEPGMTATLKRVATDEWDLLGQTVPA